MTGRMIRLVVALAAISVMWSVGVGAADKTLFINPAEYAAPVKVACVGDSITEGFGAGRGNSWPDQLGKMLGNKWAVKNFGVGGTTLMKSGVSEARRFCPRKGAQPGLGDHYARHQ